MKTRGMFVMMALVVVLGFSAACSGGGGDKEKGSANTTGTGAVAEIRINGADFSFEPATAELKAGQRYRLVFANVGKVPHDIELHDFKAKDVKIAESGAHEDEMTEMMEEAEQGKVHLHAEPGKQSVAEFTAASTGTFEMECEIAGHKEAGMVGKMQVR